MSGVAKQTGLASLGTRHNSGIQKLDVATPMGNG